jgi:hypothetical protein
MVDIRSASPIYSLALPDKSPFLIAGSPTDTRPMPQERYIAVNKNESLTPFSGSMQLHHTSFRVRWFDKVHSTASIQYRRVAISALPAAPQQLAGSCMLVSFCRTAPVAWDRGNHLSFKNTAEPSRSEC